LEHDPGLAAQLVRLDRDDVDDLSELREDRVEGLLELCDEDDDDGGGGASDRAEGGRGRDRIGTTTTDGSLALRRLDGSIDRI
jgi:hypothetical protein